MLYIRVDGNERIATGHIMRCLSIAKALRSLGEESVFILAEPYGKPIIEKEGFQTICLNGSYDKITEETEQMEELSLQQAVQQAEREAVARALALAGGNRTRAAALLGVSRRTLYDKLEDYGL